MVIAAYGTLNTSLEKYQRAQRQDEGERDSQKPYGFSERQIGKDQRYFISQSIIHVNFLRF